VADFLDAAQGSTLSMRTQPNFTGFGVYLRTFTITVTE
jgi:hypothetical protein